MYLSTLYVYIYIYIYIYIVHRQKREKAMREKKDRMINEMAAAQKKKMAAGRKVDDGCCLTHIIIFLLFELQLWQFIT